MKDDFQKRKTKKDKAKRNFERYGKYSPKHIRMQEELAEKRQFIKNTNKNKNEKSKENQ
tara:strand:- start:446 stop:622 length:177 start_codon:yes stop_codon:yes gene_type:complete